MGAKVDRTWGEVLLLVIATAAVVGVDWWLNAWGWEHVVRVVFSSAPQLGIWQVGALLMLRNVVLLDPKQRHDTVNWTASLPTSTLIAQSIGRLAGTAISVWVASCLVA